MCEKESFKPSVKMCEINVKLTSSSCTGSQSSSGIVGASCFTDSTGSEIPAGPDIRAK